MLLTPTVPYAAIIVTASGRLSIENRQKSLMRIPNCSCASGIEAPKHQGIQASSEIGLGDLSYQPPAGPERKKATVRGLTVAMTRFNQMVTACGSRAVSTAATAYSSQPGQAQERQSAGSWD